MVGISIAGCTAQSDGRYGSEYRIGSSGLDSPGANASPLKQSGKAAILLPITGSRAELGQVLLQAAQLALTDDSRVTLDVLDTGGTAAGAASAVQVAVTHNDSLIIGPLTSAETASVAPVARAAGIPVIAFTNDSSQAQPGVWPLGIAPIQQIERLVAVAQSKGRSQFAALLPANDFGRAMATAYVQAVEETGLPAPTIRMHGAGAAAITLGVREISDYANRRGPIDAKLKAARALGTIEGRHQAQDLVKTPIPPPSFDVLLLADTGDALQEIAALLTYYDIDRSSVQVIGPALWANPTSGSGAVQRGWYAAPDVTNRVKLERDYAAKYGISPPPLADLAYDAALVASALSKANESDFSFLTQQAGYIGSDGWFALMPNGAVRRGLAVFRTGQGNSEMLEPAPQPGTTPGL